MDTYLRNISFLHLLEAVFSRLALELKTRLFSRGRGFSYQDPPWPQLVNDHVGMSFNA